MVDIDKQYYYLDLEEITKYIFSENDEDSSKPNEEEQIINAKDVLVQKTVYIKNNNEKYYTVKYDMVKSMLDVIYTTGAITEEGNLKYVKEIDETSIGSKLIFNTMLVNGFIKNKLS